MLTVKCFRYDRWLEIPPSQLQLEDLVSHDGQVATVTGAAYELNGKVHIPCGPQEPSPIKLNFDDSAVNRCMDFAGTSLTEFADGTALLADLEFGAGFTYSPRLPIGDLEAFCETHMDRYEAFFKDNHEAIVSDECVLMEPWWLTIMQESGGAPSRSPELDNS